MKIIYQGENGGFWILTPSGELPIEEVAKKDVPQGVPYLFIEDSDIPADRTFKGAWEADFSNPHGFGVGHDQWFKEQEKKAAEQQVAE